MVQRNIKITKYKSTRRINGYDFISKSRIETIQETIIKNKTNK